ncbi:MAG TPA: glycoside hydrolase family 3 protein [Candidatus Faecousia intestinigallinarum]|nr:glycoside hydrolase family 3 protein [Candidatus Faecousia intestinigallinarum]
MEMTIREMLGQKLAFGFHGTALPQEFIDLLREYKVGNVILFLRNIESAAQMRRLCREIQELIQAETGHPAFIIIDQEGGMVSRLPADAVNVPCAMALAATGKVKNVEKAAQITIRQLRGLGANFNMAPDLDVNNNPQNPVIGIRSFGDDPEQVARLGAASANAYRDSGVLCCGKHFPGHGDTAVDSHLGIPRLDKTLEALERLELIPFRQAVENGIHSIMISHVMFPSIMEEAVPSTMSRQIVTGLLKEKMGYQGLVLTDCMEMGAIQAHYGTPNGVVAAIRAGVDIAEISSSLDLERASAQALNAAAEQGELDLAELRASVEKILAYKRQVAAYPVEEALCNRPEDRAEAERMAMEALTCCAGEAPLLDADTFFVGCADYRVSGAANENGYAATFPAYMAQEFGGGYLVTDKNPASEEIAAAVAQARQYSRVVLGTCNAHLFPGQIALAEALVSTGRPVTVAALRNPYDIPLLPACQCKIAAYDYALPAFKALCRVFRGEAMTGMLPVKL